ncbi:unnamed protein product [Knipowitschia caucasica]
MMQPLERNHPSTIHPHPSILSRCSLEICASPLIKTLDGDVDLPLLQTFPPQLLAHILMKRRPSAPVPAAIFPLYPPAFHLLPHSQAAPQSHVSSRSQQTGPRR